MRVACVAALLAALAATAHADDEPAPSPRLGLAAVGGVGIHDGGVADPYVAARVQVLWGRPFPGTFGYGLHAIGGWMPWTRGEAFGGAGVDAVIPLGDKLVLEPSLGLGVASVRRRGGDLLVSTGMMIGARFEEPKFVLFKTHDMAAGLRVDAWWSPSTGELESVTVGLQLDSVALLVSAVGIVGVVAFVL